MATQFSSDGEQDFSGDFSLFGDLDGDTSPSPQIPWSLAFWDRLTTLAGDVSIAQITEVIQMGALNPDTPPPAQGLIYCRAAPLAGENTKFRIENCQPADDGAVKVYWLPWVSGQVTRATMQELDASGADYFVTTKFSGCRFVVTSAEVMHVAADAGVGRLVDVGSANRTAQEDLVRTGQLVRRMSVSAGDQTSQYSAYAFAFGVKRQGVWSFVGFKRTGAGGGGGPQFVWERFQ
jgi:hypothetical protein